MGQAIGDMLPMAVGIAISPLPIIAVVLLLVSSRGRVNGVAYLVGSVLGVLGAGAILLVVAGGADAHQDGQPSGWVDWLKLGLGLALLLMAAREWRGRPRGDEEPVTPRWMGALDAFTPPKSAGAGVVLATVNPKNLVLIVAGVAAIAQTGISTGDQAAVLIIFTAIASIGVAVPVVISFTMGERSAQLLDHLKAWMAHNNGVIMAVVLVIIGAKLIGDAIAGLSS